jgi:hypothetical protein
LLGTDDLVAVGAAECAQHLFLGIVGRMTGPRQAHVMWHTTAEELVDTVISVLPKSK